MTKNSKIVKITPTSRADRAGPGSTLVRECTVLRWVETGWGTNVVSRVEWLPVRTAIPALTSGNSTPMDPQREELMVYAQG